MGIILSIGLAIALNIIVFAVLLDAGKSHERALSENATQVLTGAFGGILGVLGAYVGFKAGTNASVDQSGTPAVRSEPGTRAPSTAAPEHPEAPSAPSEQ